MLGKRLFRNVPSLAIVNRAWLEALAVQRSPTPSLVVTSTAKEVLPDAEATPRVPELPRTSSVTTGVVVHTPTFPAVTKEVPVAAGSRKDEGFCWSKNSPA